MYVLLAIKSLLRHIKERRSKVEGSSWFGNRPLPRNFSHVKITLDGCAHSNSVQLQLLCCCGS